MTPRPDRWWTRTGIAAAVACGVCCAMPLITLLGGVGALSAIGAVFEKVSLVLAVVLAVVALGGAGVLWVRRRRRRACRVPERVVDLGMPEPSTGPAGSTRSRP